jgi:hypothetical protein
MLRFAPRQSGDAVIAFGASEGCVVSGLTYGFNRKFLIGRLRLLKAHDVRLMLS